jgi:transposase
MSTATRSEECNAELRSNGAEVLFVAFELSARKWKMGMGLREGGRVRERTLGSGDLAGVLESIGRAKQRFGLSEDARVISCYEAGRDGFWIHRWLVEEGIDNKVIDAASVEVNRRQKQRKTDRLDMRKLLRALMRWCRGDKEAMKVVRVPSVEAEDARQFHRELGALKAERTRHTNRIKGLLKAHGVELSVGDDFERKLDEVRLWDGSKIPGSLRGRLQREYARLALVRDQVGLLERRRKEALAQSRDGRVAKVRKMMGLRGIGINGSWLLVFELFGWRVFRNRRELGSLAGLTPAPFASGDIGRDQGIDKAGIGRVRAVIIELAWSWLRWQPDSALSVWFKQRYGAGSKRSRRVGIVALARKLLIALWRHVEQDVVPEGAIVTSAR